jgi:aspartate beta-hydroxylase
MTDLNQRVAALLAAASSARGRGDIAAAEGELAKAMQLAGEAPHILNAYGMHALALGNFAAAQDWFVKAIAKDPAAPPLHINLATACRGAGDSAGEERALKAAVAINQLDFIAHLRLAELYQRSSDNRMAALHWRDVVQMAMGAPGDKPPLVVDALARGQTFLAEHASELSVRLDGALGSRLDALGPDARRIKACIDHSLGRRTIYTNHCDGVHVPFLPADEFFDPRLFPWFAELEAKTDAIRAEALRLVSGDNAAIRPYVRQDAGTPDNKWSPLDNSLDWSACFLWEYGAPNDAICALCPETATALAAVPQTTIPGKAPTAFFSILQAGAHIPPHTGVTNSRAIVHLPLVVPDGCRFRVGGETCVWREGEAFAFDDTIEHEAWNDSDSIRIVLILDVWNPHMTAAETELLRDFFAIADP